jgi:hypothetical protein
LNRKTRYNVQIYQTKYISNQDAVHVYLRGIPGELEHLLNHITGVQLRYILVKGTFDNDVLEFLRDVTKTNINYWQDDGTISFED